MNEISFAENKKLHEESLVYWYVTKRPEVMASELQGMESGC